jgi:hypothetical protein
VSRTGEVVARFSSDVTPDDPRLTSAIEAELAKGGWRESKGRSKAPAAALESPRWR